MKKFIGNKAFYKYLLAIAIPIVLQQFITQFVGLLDNLMVGQVGTSEMTGVSIANQLLFVFNLAVFGSLSGASIFASQYFGSKSKEGYLETFRFKLFVGCLIFIFSTILFLCFNHVLIDFFIHSREGEATDPTVVLQSGKIYLLIMIIGNFPFVVKEIYATSLREMKETLVPMISGILAICINLFLNYLLIFGKWGCPRLGIIGAAIATIVSRFVEMGIVVIYTHSHIKRFHFLKGAYRGIVKKESIRKFSPQTLLLLSNEILWSLGLTLMLSCYGYRGLDNVSAFNICNVATNVFLTVGTAMGNATSIILGFKLGANELEDAHQSSYKILAFCLFVTTLFAILMAITSSILPGIYQTSDEIKHLATILILIGAITLPVQAFNTCCYFTLRAGGKIVLTLFFDGFYIWIIKLPLAFILVHYTMLSIPLIYFIVMGIDIFKSAVGYILVDKGIWLKNMT